MISVDVAEKISSPSGAETIRIKLFGGLSVEGQSGALLRRFRTRKTASLLGYVATSGGSGIPRERLLELLWPDDEPRSARASLSTCLASIRSACLDLGLPEVLHADRFAVWLAPHIETDVSEFDRLVARSGVEEDANLQACWLQSALDLYLGPYLDGYDDDWVLAERQLRSDEYVRAVRRLLRVLGELGAKAASIKVARAGVRCEPTRESLTRDLMRLLMAANEPAAALDVYRNLERNLSKDFGIAPSPKATRLAELIEEQQFRSEQALESQPRRAKVSRSLSKFIGRAPERALVGKLLLQDHVRLVSIVGFGGVGKSRLARETTVDVQEHFENGAYWVGLDGYSSADSIWTALAQALDIATPKELAIIAMLQSRNVLIAIDNAEHLLPDLAAPIERLLGACPAIRMVVTSRRMLQMDGEHVVRLGPLVGSTSAEDAEDVRLFRSRLASANPGYDLSEDDIEELQRFVPHLGGIPLAIEMVAATTHVNAIHELSKRIPLVAGLASARVDHQGRHELLSKVIENSVRMLSPAARGLLERLWPLEAGFTWEAAQDAASYSQSGASDVMAAIRELEDFSIVYSVESRHGHRFMTLRVIREVIEAEMSGEGRRTSIESAINWLCRGTEPDDCLGYRNEQTVINGIHDADNIVAVARHAYELGLYELAVDVLTPHSAAFKLSDHIPLIIDLTRNLDSKVDPIRRLRLAACAAVLAIVGTNSVDWPTPIVDHFLDLAESSRDLRYIAVARIYKGVRTVWHEQDYRRALAEVRSALEVPREALDDATGNLVQLWANEAYVGAGEYWAILESLERLERDYGIRPGQEMQMYCAELSYSSSYVGRFEDGRRAAKQLREICERYGDYPNFGHTFFLEGTSLMRMGRYDEAVAHFDRHVDTMTKFVSLDKVGIRVGRGLAMTCCLMSGRTEEFRRRYAEFGYDLPMEIYDGVFNGEIERARIAAQTYFERGISLVRLDHVAQMFDFAAAVLAKLGREELASRLAGHATHIRNEAQVPSPHILTKLTSHVHPKEVEADLDLSEVRRLLALETLESLRAAAC